MYESGSFPSSFIPGKVNAEAVDSGVSAAFRAGEQFRSAFCFGDPDRFAIEIIYTFMEFPPCRVEESGKTAAFNLQHDPVERFRLRD